MADNREQFIQDILKIAREDAKPNFSQLQLTLQSVSAEPQHFNELRKSMEKLFKLPTIEELLVRNGCKSTKHPLDN